MGEYSGEELESNFAALCDNIKYVALDMCDGIEYTAEQLTPDSEIIADLTEAYELLKKARSYI